MSKWIDSELSDLDDLASLTPRSRPFFKGSRTTSLTPAERRERTRVRLKARYQNDPEYRARVKAKALAHYHANKAREAQS